MTSSNNKHQLIRKLIISAFLLSALVQSLPSLAHGDSAQLRAEMKQMNWNLRRAVKAETPKQLSDYLEQIQTHAENARKEGHHHASEAFNQGLNEVISTVDDIQTTVDEGNLEKPSHN